MTHNETAAASVRDRMAATGEDYPTALQAVQAERAAAQQLPAEPAAATGTETWRYIPWATPTTGDDEDHADE